jgi:CHAT domain-containing protein
MLSGLHMGDGWLTVQEVYSLSLSPEVLVLSGCATGRSSVTEGDDLFGLLRGFLHAGAPTIVSSLWPVEDEVALRFTTAFHEALDRSESPAGALRAAALSVRLTHPHPRHWAAFVLVGSGEPFSR